MAELQIATLDCETDPFKIGRIPKPFVWGLFNGALFLTFNQNINLINYLNNNELIIYTHNGGRFDFVFLKEYLVLEKEMKMINGRLAEARIGKCIIRDSFLIFPQALKTYKKDDIDYWKLEAEHRYTYMEEIIDYMFGDCKYLYEIVTEFQSKYGRRLTLASSAKGFWQKMTGRKTPHWSSVEKAQRYYDMIYPFYSGGRVEVFQSGIFQKNILVADINSAYPYAMLHEMPWGASPIIRTTLPDSNINLCLITLKGESRGYFPFKTKQGTKFPNDGEIREFNITGWEYIAVKQINPKYDCEIIKVLQFTESINFKEYVYHFFEMKKKAEKGSLDYNFAKLMMNALYGKLASDPRNHRRYMFVRPQRVSAIEESGEFRAMDIEYPYVLMEAPLTPSQMKGSYYDCATAASITGFVRAYLLKHIHKSGSPYYCDTDSVHCEFFVGIVGNDLGQWNIEFKGIEAAYAGKKLYCLRDSKGKEKKAHKGAKLTGEQIFEIARGGTVVWESEAPSMSIARQPVFIKRKLRMRKS